MSEIRGAGTATLEDIKAIDKKFLTPKDVAPYLGCNPYTVNLACKAGELPWAYMLKSRVKIPKNVFVEYHESKKS